MLRIKTYAPFCVGSGPRRGIYRITAIPYQSPRAIVMDCEASTVNEARRIFLQKYKMVRGELFVDFLKDTP